MRPNIDKYILNELIRWNMLESNNFSHWNKIHLTKLTFFLCSLDKNLMSYFSFQAYPLGFIDLEQLKYLESDTFVQYQNYGLNFIPKIEEFKIDDKLKEIVDKAILRLKEINHEIVTYSSLDLVDIATQWESFKNNKKNPDTIIKPSEIFKDSNKIYQLK